MRENPISLILKLNHKTKGGTFKGPWRMSIVHKLVCLSRSTIHADKTRAINPLGRSHSQILSLTPDGPAVSMITTQRALVRLYACMLGFCHWHTLEIITRTLCEVVNRVRLCGHHTRRSSRVEVHVPCLTRGLAWLLGCGNSVTLWRSSRALYAKW